MTCVMFAHAEVAAAQGRAIYVSPNGVAGRDGSLANPIDLVSALSASGPARPGDTVWLRGGTYRGAFTSNLNGTAAAPIVVRQYPGERATLDNASNPTLPTLIVNGSWTTYWGFEITNSYPNRFVDIAGRGTGLDVYGPNTKFINMVIHDAQVGVGFWTPAVNAEIYGSVIYNNGIEWTDRGHGHSIYTQNGSGTKRIVDNIMFNGFSFGIHAYTQGGNIDNLVMDGNVSFNHGVLSSGGLKSGLLLGGGQVARNPVITNNHLYNSPGFGGRGADIGYGTACAGGTVQNNVFASDTALMLNCATTFTGNQVYGGINFASGSYPSNTYHSARPTGSWVSIRPNLYEPGRANIVIYNWSRAASVAVNLAQAGLAAGDSYEIRDAQNFYGPAIATGVFNGTSASVPMTSNVVAMPLGTGFVTPRHTDSDFGVFVVLRVSGSSAPVAPTATLTASPASVPVGGSATLAWSTTNASSVTINQGIGAVAAAGTRVVSPTATTTYTVTALNASGQATTATATITVATTPNPPTGSAAATFVAVDSTTLGNWRGAYGADGYAIAPAAMALPSYAQFSSNAAAYTWTGSATEPRALVQPSGTARTASTWYSTQTFDFTLNLVDGQPHRVAVYALDWDRQLRAQQFEIIDAATGAVLDRRDASSFGDGRYWIWRITGRVVIRVTRTGGPSPVAAAVFFDPASTTTPPPPTATPAVTFSATPIAITTGQSATLTWTSTNASSVSIDQGVGAVAASGSKAVSPTATTTYRIVASNGSAQAAANVTVTVNATPPGPGTGTATAAFTRSDTVTQGNWRGVYGSEGHLVAPSTMAAPSYAEVSVGGVAYTWDANPNDPRALQLPSGSSRIAATWYGADAFAFNVKITDGQTHEISLYSLDWDRQGRAQSVEVLDAATMQLLDRRDTAAMSGGVYTTWRISGRVIFRITRTAGPSPVIAGLFFGPASSTPPSPSQPTVTLAASANAGTPASTLTWTSTNAASVSIAPAIGQVALSGSRVVTPPATTTYTVTATSASGQVASATAVVNVGSVPPPAAGGVTFLGVDTTTRGNWRGAFGQQGFILAPASSSLPAFATVTVNGAAWTWESATNDPRGLQTATGSSRTAATWHGSTTFTIDINLTDGQPHQVAVYAMDWDGQGRMQTIEVVDPVSGAVLDRQDTGVFSGGKYFKWRVTRRVTLRVTKTAGPSPAIGGVFIDP
jgi:hypothetical protein